VRSLVPYSVRRQVRLAHRLEESQLLLIASRIRVRLHTEALPPVQLLQCVNHLLKMAGNSKLMNPSLLQTLCEHAAQPPPAHEHGQRSWLRLFTRNANRLMKRSSSRFLALDPKPTPNAQKLPGAGPARQCRLRHSLSTPLCCSAHRSRAPGSHRRLPDRGPGAWKGSARRRVSTSSLCLSR
jgi:hypothetical protein